jgi:putative FmdB family regulatory protein
MVYEYHCKSCLHAFDVIKSVKEIDRPEACEKCKSETSRQFVISPNALIKRSGLSESAEFNPAFGQVIKNKRHMRYEAEKRGMVQVGNDFGSAESMQKHYDKVREEKRERAYDDV